MAQSVTFPVGRMVGGSLYKMQTTDADGKPLVVKTGPNAGQPRETVYFAVAIPKAGETHWAQTQWGKVLRAEGAAAFPQACQSPAFAWKVTDGDDQIPNKKGKRPCDQEGYPGHWVIRFGGGFLPKIYRQEGSSFVQDARPDFVKPGYFVEVNASINGNGSSQQPGIYINPMMVCFRAYGPEIVIGPDVASAGFGLSALPPGASMTPPAGLPMPPAAPQVPAMPPQPPAAPQVPAMPPAAMLTAASVVPNPHFLTAAIPQPPAMPPAAMLTAASVVPNPHFLTAAIPQPPAAVPQVPVPPQRQMTDLARGASYDQLIAQGWTDALLVQHGLMIA